MERIARDVYLQKVTKSTPEKYCEFCGRRLERKKFLNRKEDLGVFKRRKYCNRDCMKKAFLKIGISNEQSYREAHSTARKIAENFLDITKCSICGSPQNIDVHHKNGNWKDNSIENLEVLCRSCHTKTHKTKSICKVEGCNNLVKGLGYCDKHYQRFKKYGSPLVVRWNTRHTKNENGVLNAIPR